MAMPLCNQADLFGEVEIKIEELSSPPDPYRIIDKAIGNGCSDRVLSIILREAGVNPFCLLSFRFLGGTTGFPHSPVISAERAYFLRRLERTIHRIATVYQRLVLLG